MITSAVDLTATRGDTWLRVIPLEVLAPAGTRTPLPAADIEALAARFTRLRLQVRASDDAPDVLLDLSSEAGEVRFDGAAGGLVLEGPAEKMSEFPGGKYDLQATEPRPGHPLGDLVWTLCRGTVKVTKDRTR